MWIEGGDFETRRWDQPEWALVSVIRSCLAVREVLGAVWTKLSTEIIDVISEVLGVVIFCNIEAAKFEFIIFGLFGLPLVQRSHTLLSPIQPLLSVPNWRRQLRSSHLFHTLNSGVNIQRPKSTT